MQTFVSSLLLLVVLGLSLANIEPTLANIENEPMKVTHKNSGPKYEFAEVERTKLDGSNQDSQDNQILPLRPPTPPQAEEADAPTLGHISIRRIFLVPMEPAGQLGALPSESQQQPPVGGEPNLLLRGSLWPFFPPAPQRHHQQQQHHLFGQDEASRNHNKPDVEPMVSSQSGEREQQQQSPHALLDPIQMMVNMMQHMLNPVANTGNTFLTDLANEASNNNNNNNNSNDNQDKTALDKLPGGHNVTKEDIVEIDGKKYLRKMVTSRHVGENLIFMTKRLIFVPLNETETITTTTSSVTTQAPPASVERESESASTKKPEQEATTTSSTSTTSTTTTTTTLAPNVEDVARNNAKIEAEQTSTTTTASIQEASSQPPTTPLDNNKEPATSTLDLIKKAAASK